MKHIYTFISLFLISVSAFSQGYEFGIVHNSDYNFSIVAIPDFDSTNTDVSDIGFTLMLPTGNADVINLGPFNGRAWTATEVTAAQLTGLGLGDGTRDGFVINLPPGQTILSHTSGQQIILVTFDISNMPLTGLLEILSNTDPIAIGLGGAGDSFYNANIDNTSTQNYFSGLAVGMESFMFDTLNIDEVSLVDNNIKVYPNPASEVINIISTNVTIDYIELYDLSGKQVIKTIQTDQLSINNLKPGIYLLKISSSEGYSIKKIIKR